MRRRQFLQASALATGTCTLALTQARADAPPRTKRFIVVLLRGALDGLSVLVPYSDSDYYDLRPTTAIAPPDQSGAHPLTAQFALAPALQSLVPLWQQKQLAFIVASGSPDPTRSHFDAQLYLENGTPGRKNTEDGWLNRLVRALANGYPVQALNLGNTTPQILKGSYPIASLSTGPQGDRPQPLDNPTIAEAFDQLYAGNSAIAQVYQQARSARSILLTNLQQEMITADQNAPAPSRFGRHVQQIARQMAQDARIQIAFTAVGGWDTHVNQGNERGPLANKLADLSQGLAQLPQALGPVYDDTVVVVMSEFGRTVKENITGGTDHGHGNVMLILGGPIQGGKIYGQWSGLAPQALNDQREVPVTTDFRDPLWCIAHHHLGLKTSALAQVFPQFSPASPLSLVRG